VLLFSLYIASIIDKAKIKSHPRSKNVIDGKHPC
jgi:hypothetical protein